MQFFIINIRNALEIFRNSFYTKYIALVNRKEIIKKGKMKLKINYSMQMMEKLKFQKFPLKLNECYS